MSSTGTMVARYAYDPYGRPPPGQTTNFVPGSGTDLATKQYTGDYYHATSGLNLTKYRAYDSNTGRWLSRDPISERGGINLYGYVFNSSINATDPLGLRPGDHFPTADAAGEDAIRFILPTSIAEQREYAGRICKCEKGNYYFATGPFPGGKTTSTPGSCPDGTTPSGAYHTHPIRGPIPGDNSPEDFSDDDTALLDGLHQPGYLGTPSGAIKKYDPNKPGPFWQFYPPGTTTTLSPGSKSK